MADRADPATAGGVSNSLGRASRPANHGVRVRNPRRMLERLAQALSGTRNDSLNRAAFALGQLVAEGARDEVETAAALTQAGQDLGLGLTECERTVASGLSAGMEQPRGMAIG
jgi:hypothetical protein